MLFIDFNSLLCFCIKINTTALLDAPVYKTFWKIGLCQGFWIFQIFLSTFEAFLTIYDLVEFFQQMK